MKPALRQFVLTVAVIFCFANAAQASEFVATGWAVARSPHFEVYSQAGSDRAKLTLTHFEELRSFFERYRIAQAASELPEKGPVRVVEFSSRKEYEPFKLRAADAYYNSTPDRDYIVMPQSGPGAFGIAAHEYSHFVLHSSGLTLPAWLGEGLAELFSTVTITSRRCEFGGPLPARVETLHRHSWLTASELFASEANLRFRQTRDGAAIFYAESWALTDMLTSSPAYAPRFQDFILMLNSGQVSSEQAVARVFMKSPDTLFRDAQDWIGHARSERHAFPWLAPENFKVVVVPVAEFQAKAVVADLLCANQEYDRAEVLYKESLSEAQADPQILASLGAVELRKGNRGEALQCWRRALAGGLVDANLCYRYALVAEEMNLPSDQVKHALEQAITANQHFNDARYKLALLESNSGNYGAAVSQLQAIAKPQPQRAFAYWSALSYALTELGRREEAESAAHQAMRVAASPEDRARAAELVYVAKTDLAVRFTRDASGNPQLVTTRVLHGTTDFNPFVETGDHIRVAAGTLREVQCSEGKLTGFLVESDTGLLTLSVPDPTHVLVRNGPSEFTCGVQPAKGVKLEYAAASQPDRGLLRGIEFQ